VTFLFTDIEGSTRRWESDTDGMRAALAAHDEVLRCAIEAQGGDGPSWKCPTGYL
jgi:class 3 adenylate cyclase